MKQIIKYATLSIISFLAFACGIWYYCIVPAINHEKQLLKIKAIDERKLLDTNIELAVFEIQIRNLKHEEILKQKQKESEEK